MALAVGHEVAYFQDVANNSYTARNGDFAFGVVADDAGGDFDVLWENGTYVADVPGAALDKITSVAAGAAAGSVVSFGGNSPEYYGILVRAYNRQPAGTGTTTPYALIRLISTGELVEVPFTSVAVVTGR